MNLRPYQIDIVEQCRDAYRHGYNAPCIVLPCGGGKSVIVAKIAYSATSRGNRVLFLVHRRELCEQIESTFIANNVNMNLCDIMMVQTASRRLLKLKQPQLIITDENHHSLANTYRKIYDYFPNAKRVGVTATPVRLDGSGLADVNDVLVQGVSAKWLIDNNFLASYDYYAPSLVDLADVKISKGEFDVQAVEQKMLKKAIFGDVIKHYRQLADDKQAICYCISISYSVSVASAFNDAGITASHIDGNTPQNERAEIINKFRSGEIQILCNVDLISEGFDVPDCECAILLRPTKSLTLYIQQSMRCMRYKPGKRAIIIDHVGNYARFGLPDADRTWRLDSKKKSKNETGDLDIATCEQCFSTCAKHNGDKLVIKCPQCGNTLYPTECEHCGNIFSKYSETGVLINKCPECGTVVESKENKIQEESDAKLEKIENFTLDLKDWRDCKTYPELLAYAKSRGYKSGWCYYKAKELGLLHKSIK